MPILLTLGAKVTTLPLVGHVPYPLVTSVVVWSVFGSLMLALVGVRLPRIAFRTQRVEAAYRKELVHGEDDESRAHPTTLAELFLAIRQNYFSVYFNWAYFGMAKWLYLAIDVMVAYALLGPTIISGTITLGFLTRASSAFGTVQRAFQYLIDSSDRIVDLMSIYRRLRAFEASLQGQSLPKIEAEVHAGQDAS